MSTLVRPGRTPAQRCRYVADLIESNPEHFAMAFWYGGDEENLLTTDHGERPSDERIDLTDHCGMTACIGGWTIAATPPSEVPDGNMGTATSLLLGLELDDEDGSDLLYNMRLKPLDAVYLLRVHADTLDAADAR